MRIVRKVDGGNLVSDFNYTYADDERYRHYFIGDWLPVKTSFDGWEEDLLFYEGRQGEIFGFSVVSMNRNHNSIDNISLVLYPEYLNTGAGFYCFRTLSTYLKDRGFRRAELKVCVGNTLMNRIIASSFFKSKIRYVGLLKAAFKLRQTGYSDVYLYEWLSERSE